MRSAYLLVLYNMIYGQENKKSNDHHCHNSVALSCPSRNEPCNRAIIRRGFIQTSNMFGTVLGFARQGIIHDVGGFNGAMSECVQIQWSGSIYD